MDNALQLKSYTTAQRDALTSVAGDTIYNSDDNKVQVYTGSAWEDLGAGTIAVDYLVVAGGGSGGTNATGGGGAGGLRSTVGNTGGGGSLESSIFLDTGVNYTVLVGAGGASETPNVVQGYNGTCSIFASITSVEVVEVQMLHLLTMENLVALVEELLVLQVMVVQE